jgi:hypothetical protein
VIPSAKYCCSRSSLRFVKGRTTIDRRGDGRRDRDGRRTPRSRRAGYGAGTPSVDPHRPRDVLDALLAPVLEQLPCPLAVRTCRLRRQPVPEPVEVDRKINLEVCDRLSVYSSRPLVGLHTWTEAALFSRARGQPATGGSPRTRQSRSTSPSGKSGKPSNRTSPAASFYSSSSGRGRNRGAKSCGEAVFFPVHHRLVEGTRGPYRVTMRHGVGRLRSGQRYTLGIIFHDAA